MTKRIKIAASSFSSPLSLWPLLAQGTSIVFNEFMESGIHPAHISLGDQGLDLEWRPDYLGNARKTYSRSIHGLESALNDNVSRLIESRYSRWLCSVDQYDKNLNVRYVALVEIYKRAIHEDFRLYFGVNRNIEAGSTYSHFLRDEATLLMFFNYGLIYEWQEAFERRMVCSGKPIRDKDPIDRTVNPNLIEFKAYTIEHIPTRRVTVVDILDLTSITSKMINSWLNMGYEIMYNQRTFFEADVDGTG